MSKSEGGLLVSHVAEPARRYPGETVVLRTRVVLAAPLGGFSVRVSVPDGMTSGAATASPDASDGPADLLVLEGERFILWQRNRPAEAGARFEFQVEAVVEGTPVDGPLHSTAIAQSSGAGGRRAWSEETTGIQVTAQARCLKYLPAVYAEQDELMGRFVMLFESYWTPLDQMIGSVHNYLDPRLAPADLLPWLASCVDLTLNDQWTEAQMRRLIASALQLYRKRGTRQGLIEFLEIYSGHTPQVVEHRANNLRLGVDARLAASVALGQKNVPHTFSVVLTLPPAEGRDADERRRRESDRRRMIEAIIDAEKPAHTSYDLEIRVTNR